MNNIDPDVLEHAKRIYGENCELVRKTEWSYTFKCGPNSYCNLSRFLAETGFKVSAAEIRQRWPVMTQHERMDFASNWWSKGTWSDDDTEILEIIMVDGDDHVWQSCTQAFLKHPNRDRAVSFLIERVLHYSLTHEPLNYIQVLGMSKDKRAVAAIRPYYEKYREAMSMEAVTGVPEDVFFGPIPYHAYFAAAGALFKIGGSPDYDEGIRRYFDHPNEQVRWWAENALELEGPTTAKRNAEYKKKRAKDEGPS